MDIGKLLLFAIILIALIGAALFALFRDNLKGNNSSDTQQQTHEPKKEIKKIVEPENAFPPETKVPPFSSEQENSPAEPSEDDKINAEIMKDGNLTVNMKYSESDVNDYIMRAPTNGTQTLNKKQ
ncbi:MAG: hypothetical protein E7496_05570 [Ruminococcus sp.]|nr:hypothetical protein [Ruminococcus sp.]